MANIRSGSIVDGNADKASRTLRFVSVKQRGVVSIENTLNSMTGDISYEDLQKIVGISTMALRAKEKAGDTSIFQKKDYSSPLSKIGAGDITYWNISLLLNFVSGSGKIVPTRISGVSKNQQRRIKSSIKIARFLGLYCMNDLTIIL